MEARLPQDKLSELRGLLRDNMQRKKIRFKDLQSLLGHLNCACKVIKPGRCCLYRLYDLTWVLIGLIILLSSILQLGLTLRFGLLS